MTNLTAGKAPYFRFIDEQEAYVAFAELLKQARQVRCLFESAGVRLEQMPASLRRLFDEPPTSTAALPNWRCRGETVTDLESRARQLVLAHQESSMAAAIEAITALARAVEVEAYETAAEKCDGVAAKFSSMTGIRSAVAEDCARAIRALAKGMP